MSEHGHHGDPGDPGDPGGEGLQASQPIELSSDSESTAPPSVNDDAPGFHDMVCPWRTSQHNDDECSRYFDCPSHTVERARSESDGDNEDGNRSNVVETMSGDADDAVIHPPADDLTGEDGTPPLPQEPPGLATAHDREHLSRTAGLQEGAAHETAGNPVVVSDDSPSPLPSLARSDPTPVVIEDDDGVTDSGESPAQRSARQMALPESPSGSPSQEVEHRVAPGPAIEADSEPMQTSRGPRRPDSQTYVPPRWQPDAEVTYCPICHTQFSIFIRKHHCRKCGRVVCNSCSPHRITIPYQYIVQPPGAYRMPAQSLTPSLVGGGAGAADFNSLGGGERVRLCNPCVPDPNISPPQAQNPLSPRAHGRSRSGVNQGHPGSNATSSTWGSYFGVVPVTDAYARGRSVTMASNAGSPSTRPPSNPYPPSSTHNRILSGTPPAYFPPHPSTAQRLYNDQGRFRTLYDLLDSGGPGPSSAAAAASSSSAAALANRRLPPIPQPRPQIAEEDECPVCHRELPERTLPNFEALRESHITICIATHSAYGSTPTASSGGGAAGGNTGSPPPPPPPRRTGMFPYTATEKDCVDSAECTICLEEFEVGVPMARLECLCRFHRRCISAWWQRHPGRCPMHQHDSLGY